MKQISFTCVSVPGGGSTFGPNAPDERSASSSGSIAWYVSSTSCGSQRHVHADRGGEIPRVHERVGRHEPREELVERDRAHRTLDLTREAFVGERAEGRVARLRVGTSGILLERGRLTGRAGNALHPADDVREHVPRGPALAGRLCRPRVVRYRVDHAREAVDRAPVLVAALAHPRPPFVPVRGSLTDGDTLDNAEVPRRREARRQTRNTTTYVAPVSVSNSS